MISVWCLYIIFNVQAIYTENVHDIKSLKTLKLKFLFVEEFVKTNVDCYYK